MEDDWDLHAVVRGCTPSSSSSTTTASCSFRPQQHHDDDDDNNFLFFPDPFESTSIENVVELHDLFKPFFPKSQPLSPQTTPISPLSVLGGLQDLSPPPPPPPPQQENQKQKQKQSVAAAAGSTTIPASSTSVTTTNTTTSHTPSPRSKRRKNQLKRVCQVPAEGLSADTWSWRKYGQKPIKGSPYPRGYYRCSTSKGCLARKQVERNRSDPGMFIVTFTGEHNHPMPTHRNSLAGSTRQKPQTAAAGDAGKPCCSPPVSPAASLSPATEKMEVEDREDLAAAVEDEDDEFGVSDMVSDDFFEGLEELTGLITGDCYPDQLPASFPFPWLANKATTTAAGGS